MTDVTRKALKETDGFAGPRCRVHAVAFEDPQLTLTAAKRLKGAGYLIADVHSPFPIHGIDEALGWRETRIGYVTLTGGLVGLTCGVLLQALTHGLSWPLDIGGKTDLAIPAMAPVMFELTVLIAAFSSVFAFFFRRRLRPRLNLQAELGQPPFRVNDDHFVLLVVEQDGSFNRKEFLELCEELRSIKVHESWKVLS